MIGGLIVDALFVAAVVAFAWGAAQLGGISALARLLEATAAFIAAALLRDPIGELVQGLIGASIDFSRLAGMLIVATGVWIATHSVYRWWRARREESRRSSDEDMDEYDEPDLDPLDSSIVARIAGSLLGIGWVMLFVSLLVLQPSDSIISRAAVSSYPGGSLIAREHTLRWLHQGFPHYTQTLPKGKLGAVVGEQDDLPMRSPIRSKPVPGDDDKMLRAINELRRNARVQTLIYNPNVAAVARRHARSLVEDTALSYREPGGGTLDSKVLLSLGESQGGFAEDVGIEVVWSQDPANAMRGLLDSTRSRALLRDARWTEIGIGVVSGGWFNGRIYVMILIGDEAGTTSETESTDSPQESAASPAEAAEFDDPNVVPDEVDPNESVGDCISPEPFDLDGDGVPDEESVDPSLECEDETATPAP